MGKLGGRELGYHSDLDLIFLYPADEEPGGPGAGQSGTHQLYARLAQRLMAFLQMPLREGFLYKIDTRLRPSGNQGALVISVQGFTRYHTAGGAQVRSQLWERQALLRARHVAGDAPLWKQVHERVILPAAYGPVADPGAMAAEIRRPPRRWPCSACTASRDNASEIVHIGQTVMASRDINDVRISSKRRARRWTFSYTITKQPGFIGLP